MSTGVDLGKSQIWCCSTDVSFTWLSWGFPQFFCLGLHSECPRFPHHFHASNLKGLSSLLDRRLYLGGDLVDPVDLLNHLYLGTEKYQTDGWCLDGFGMDMEGPIKNVRNKKYADGWWMIQRHFYNLYRAIEAEGWNRCPKYENLVHEIFTKFCLPLTGGLKLMTSLKPTLNIIWSLWYSSRELLPQFKPKP